MIDTVCLYHKDCFDGLGAAWATKLAYPDAAFIATDYRDPLPDGLDGKRVIVVDFSYPIESMIILTQVAAELIFLDHHPRSKEIVEQLNQIQTTALGFPICARFEDSRSGAMMAWEFFFGQTDPPALIRHISNRDLWLEQEQQSFEIMEAVALYPMNLDEWDDLFCWRRDRSYPENVDAHNARIEPLASLGRTLRVKMQQDYLRIIDQTQRTIELGGVSVPLINVPRGLGSEAIGYLAQSHPFAAGYYDDATHRIFSLRSKRGSGANVRAIAEQYGGGGLYHASGFTVPRTDPLAQY